MTGRQIWVEVALPQHFENKKWLYKTFKTAFYSVTRLVAVLKQAKTHQIQHNNHTG